MKSAEEQEATKKKQAATNIQRIFRGYAGKKIVEQARLVQKTEEKKEELLEKEELSKYFEIEQERFKKAAKDAEEAKAEVTKEREALRAAEEIIKKEVKALARDLLCNFIKETLNSNSLKGAGGWKLKNGELTQDQIMSLYNKIAGSFNVETNPETFLIEDTCNIENFKNQQGYTLENAMFWALSDLFRENQGVINKDLFYNCKSNSSSSCKRR